MKQSQAGHIFQGTYYGEWTNILEKYGEKMCVPEGYRFIHAGDKSSCCYIIKSGRISAYEYQKSGDIRIYYYSEKYAMILEEYMMTGRCCDMEYMSVTPVEVIKLHKERFQKFLLENPKAVSAFMNGMSEKNIFVTERLRNECNENATWKTCDILLNLAQRYGRQKGDKVLIKEHISQQEMANIIGVNRVTMVREIRNLKNRALITKEGKYYCIINIEQLSAYQNEMCS